LAINARRRWGRRGDDRGDDLTPKTNDNNDYDKINNNDDDDKITINYTVDY
jgi:hypothetical protein